jgi:hypothetical protein
MLRSEVQKVLKTQLTEILQTKDNNDSEMLVETIRADYLSKMLEMEQTFHHENEALKAQMEQERLEMRKEIKDIVQTTKEIILHKFAEVQDLVKLR